MSYFDHLEKYNNNIALINKKEKIKYSDLLIYSDQISNKIKERSLILLICQNSVESLSGYVSFVRAKCVILLFNNKLTEKDFLTLINDYRPDYIFISKKKFTCKINYQNIFNFRNYELLKNKNNEKHRFNKNLALLMPTSGTMGSSKLVRQSYENIICNILQIDDFLKIKNSDCSITTMPMNYTYGLSIIHTHIYKGASIVLSEEGLTSKNFWELFINHKITNFGGVPYIYEILKKLDFEKKKLKYLKYITQAGGKLTEDISLDFVNICKKKNIKMIFMYGQTEATARMSYLPWNFAEKKIGSIGKPVSNGRFWLKDTKGNLINEPNTIGELVYEGKNVSLGYSKNFKDLNKEDDNKEVLYTGDLAKRDSDNFYYIVGRSNRFFKVFGIRINLDDVESLIKKWGYDCACIGDYSKIKIFISNKFNKNDLLEKISKEVGIHKSGLVLILIKEIPRNKTGKILYSELKLI